MRIPFTKMNIWLIMLSVSFAASLTGCSAPRSQTKLPTFSQMQQKAAIETHSSEQPEEKKSEDEAPSPAPQKRLLTLREQMNKVAEDQDALRRQQENITEQVVTTKQDVRQIKETLEDIKLTLRQMQGQPMPEAVKGGPAPERSKERAEPAQPVKKEKKNLILPDNVMNETFEPAPKKTLAKSENLIMPDKPAKKTVKKAANINPELAMASEGRVNIGTKGKASKPVIPDTEQPVVAEAKAPVMPAETKVQYSSAMNLFSKKQYNEVIPLLNEVVKKEKNPVVVGNSYYWLGESYFGLGQYDQAINHFQKVLALKASTKRDTAQVMIAESQIRKGNIAEAKRSFQRVLDVYPTSEYVPRAKKMLQKL